MDTLIDFGLLLLGGVMLYYGAEWLVRGAAGLARAFGIAPIVVGLTIVSYGTSAPELAVSVVATLGGQPAISLGNVVGSNIANIGLILGITALVAPPRVDSGLIRRELPFLLIATFALPVVLLDSEISRTEGAVFLGGAIFFTFATFFWVGDRGMPQELEEEEVEHLGKAALIGLFLVGLALLVGGGKAFVVGASEIAAMLGVSERVIGLTVVAIGTSLPELAASVVAAVRGHSELAVGNVVGSNLFNILLILGATASIRPVVGELSVMALDIVFMSMLTVVAAVSMRGDRVIGRAEGGLYCAVYAAFIIALAAA